VTLPDCPQCDAASSLTAVSAEPRGVRVCYCSVCGKQCRVDANGAIVHAADVRDLSGHVIDGP
jgi:transcription elongation factor Elf1